MRMTKFTHSCVRIEKPGEPAGSGRGQRVLVIDPGNFSEVEDALEGADAFLVTHEHPDHLDMARVTAVLEKSPSLEAWAPAKAARELKEAAPSCAERVHVTEPDAEFEAGGFRLKTFGSQHALIHASVPVVANIGYLVDDDLFHPGDSFTVPHGARVGTLLVPIHAPWSKIGEVLDFIIAVRAPRALPIHNALLNERGTGLVEKHAERISELYGTEFTHLEPGESVEL
ncbi:MBL fold metallo-hydrolase [Sinomonas notoginsengisoli]|uniref:MBL fold metallo-hydrolase n=1 Tax=Sinomonas notoginsengisoli TaxID=1457311 RepID=UPI001F23827E|nr:MBL fold metallo-hydrolase [Sinomonas notoginsengisoli]